MSAFAKCESPIESAFLAALMDEGLDNGFTTLVVGCGEPTGCAHPDDAGDGPTIVVQPQLDVPEMWRFDFLVRVRGGSCAVVECDGHDYHERTKEQAKRDRQRDRAVQAVGGRILRFTGSEIWADARGCAAETISACVGNDV